MTASFHTCAATDSNMAASVQVTGEIDLANAEEFSSALGAALRDGSRLTVDLSATTYLDSAAIKVLFEWTHRAALTLIVPGDGIVAPVISLAGLDTVATVRAPTA
jgi:anti-anti-sigma factor